MIPVDPFDEHTTRLKRKTEQHCQGGRLEALQRLLSDLIETSLAFEGRNFSAYIKEKTGYDINIFENIEEHIPANTRRSKGKVAIIENGFFKQVAEVYSPNGKRKISITELGPDINRASTQVSLVIEGAGGISLYGVNGTNLDIHALWKDNYTIVIDTRKTYINTYRTSAQYQQGDDILEVEIIEH